MKLVALKTVLFLFISVSISFAGTIKGKVVDKQTKEPLVGANVTVKNSKLGASAGLDGSFVFKQLQPGVYQITAQYVGYESISMSVTITDAKSSPEIEFALVEKSNYLQEAVVSAKNLGESDDFARKSEQKAESVINIIGAKAIELLPDVTVGNLLQRVSGVSVVRNSSGDGQYAIIRGMDKRYNYTAVNGIKIPSPDDKNRYVPMDIFPSNLLGRLEVIKALTPNMEGDAIGGAMNMVMKSVPDYLIISGTASGGYSQIFNSQDFKGFSKTTNMDPPSVVHGITYMAKPSDFSINTLQYKKVPVPMNSLLSLSIGNRILNHKLGFLFGGSYQSTYRGSKSSFFSLNGQPNADPKPNTPIFESVQNRIYSNQQARLGLNLKLDYDINASNKISLYSLFMQLEDWQHRQMLSNQLTKFGDVGMNDRSVYRQQNINNFTLHGEHQVLDKLKIDWSGAYSIASSKTPDWTNLSVTYRTAPDLNGMPIESARYVDNVTHIWTHNEDHDFTGFLNFTYPLKNNIELAAGGMIRRKDRKNYYNDYSLATVLPGAVRQIYTSIDKVIFSFPQNAYAYADSTNANNYTATEDINAAYGQAKINIKDLQILGGVRIESTDQTYKSKLPETATGKNGHVSYIDILPSLHLRYALSPKENLRFSYFKGISRPGYFELVPASFPGEYFTEQGNFKLKHTQADNIDLRYELFPSGSEQLLVGAFFKNIINPIEYGFTQYGNATYVYTPLNFGNAKNYGFELVFNKFIKNWGISGNYTYTHSRITTTKRIYGRDNAGNIVNTLGQQSRPLQGQSDHIANLSLIYKAPKIGADAQLSCVYTGQRINIVSPYLGLDYWQHGTAQLDFSAEKTLGKSKFAVFTKITNLLNNPIIVEVLKENTLAGLPEQTSNDRIVVQKDIIQQSYLIGLRYKY
jgi:outer membrane receptor protein involved in Fe transport